MIQKIVPERGRKALIDVADKFLDGLMSLRSPAQALMILLSSILIWLLERASIGAWIRRWGWD